MIRAIVSVVFSGLLATGAHGDELSAAINAVRKVGAQGEGNTDAATAWKTLADSNPANLTALLSGLDGATPIGANYLRSAIDAVVDRAVDRRVALSPGDLEAFLFERSHEPRARRLAFEILTRFDPSAADRLVPRMLDDPSVELRRDAVALLLAQAGSASDKGQSASLYEQAFGAARDEDQIKTALAALAKLGKNVDLPRHYGFLMEWKLIGPFDNRGGKGFAAVYPPETEPFDPKKTYDGRDGKVEWKDHSSTDAKGVVDLNRAIAKMSGATAYAHADFHSDRDQSVDVRLGCINACKVWVNGRLVFQREEYHAGMYVDQYRASVPIVQGRNQILVKICQNEQKESWAQAWRFQLRICDPTGTAILSRTRPPTPPLQPEKSDS